MPFCTFVDKLKYFNNRKYENKQSENAEDKISVEFSPYFIIEVLGMRKVFHNKLSFMGAGFNGCKKHFISLLYHKEQVFIHRCNHVIVISLKRCKNL